MSVSCPQDGVFVPAKTSQAIVDTFYAAAVKALQSPTTRAKLTQLAVDPLPMTPAEFDKRVADEIVANEKLIKAAGIK